MKNLDKEKEYFRKGLNKFLLDKNLFGTALAEKIGIQPYLISNWRNGKGFPSFENICRLLKVGCSLNYLFDIESKIESKNESEIETILNDETFKKSIENAIKEILNKK